MTAGAAARSRGVGPYGGGIRSIEEHEPSGLQRPIVVSGLDLVIVVALVAGIPC